MFNKISLVARHEFLSTLKRRSALFVIFGLPILSMLVLTGINALSGSQGDEEGGANAFTNFVMGEEESRPLGLVDETGQIATFTPPTDTMFLPFASVAEAEAAFDDETIRGYYRIPADYLESGEIYFYALDLGIETPDDFFLFQVLTANFIEDPTLAAQVLLPMKNYQEINLAAGVETEATDVAGGLAMGMGIAILFYLTAMGASGYLLQSLGKEKQNRVMEILLSSARPFELLVGKIIGLGGIGIIQIVVWSAIALTVFRGESSFLTNISLPTLAPGTWVVIVLHFIVGYLVYSSLFAGLGAITPGTKESSQYTFFIMLPTFLPMWFNSVLISAPNGTMAMTLSFIPLTAPITVPMRLAITAVPVWQWVLSLSLSLATAVLLIWLATKLFHSRTLLSGKTLGLKTAWQILREA